MPHNVRTHTRRTASRGATTVRQHRRRGGPTPGHAWQSARRGCSAARRKRRGWAAAWFTFALLEVALWFTFQVTGVVCGAVGALLIGVSVLLVRQRGGWR